jgi:hypothetical protein
MQAMAVEMVYVAAGDFAAGSGGTETSAFTLTTISTSAGERGSPTGTRNEWGERPGVIRKARPRPNGELAQRVFGVLLHEVRNQPGPIQRTF